MTPRWILFAFFGLFLVPGAAQGQVRVNAPTNKHNLSTTGPGPVKSTTVTEVCIFCHTPHNATPAAALWNQQLSGATYTPYTSTTLRANRNATTGIGSGGVPAAGSSSKLCLSCHDGTVAIGTTSMGTRLPGMQGVSAGGMLTGTAAIGPNLSNDHPIAFVPAVASDLKTPGATSPVQLDPGGMIQCNTCHDPHQMDIDTTTKKFLVMNNSGSALCVVCHTQPYWSSNPSSHMTSTKSYTAAQGAHTGYTTVATNGCESCHRPHNASATSQRGLPQMGLKFTEEKTCGSGGSQCHGSSGVGRNIESEYLKTYRHPAYTATTSVHDASEGPTSTSFPLPETSTAATRHGECQDCHNPHASYAATTSAPKASGKLAGVWGINTAGAKVLPTGTPASVNEYEICYKCHSYSKNQPQPGSTATFGTYPNRVIPEYNKAKSFDPANVSYHPIAAAAKATASPSLLAPWTLTSIISCTDCHDSDDGPQGANTGGPSGPHGSQWPHILALKDNMVDNTAESAAQYALCYKCHNRTIILGTTSFREHKKHISDERTPCSTCHDPHGISGGATRTRTNNGHLINFNMTVVTMKTGLPGWVQTATGKGYCNLTCHGKSHSINENY